MFLGKGGGFHEKISPFMSEMKSRDCHNGEHSSKKPLHMHSWGKLHQAFRNLYLDSLDLIYIWKSFRTPIRAKKKKK